MTPSSECGRGARLRRSCLAVPGSSEKMLAKAATLAADMVFVDLEDAVAPQEKTDATRARVVAALRGQEWAAPTRAVRVNAVDTPWCLATSLALVEGAGRALDCIMVPKVESAAQVHFVAQPAHQLERSSGSSAGSGSRCRSRARAASSRSSEIAAASPRIETLIFGPGDFAAVARDAAAHRRRDRPLYPGDQWHYVLLADRRPPRTLGLPGDRRPVRGDPRPRGIPRGRPRRSRLLGFDGKWALHPDQIGVCNEIYAPTAAELERAERILEAYAATAGARAAALPCSRAR